MDETSASANDATDHNSWGRPDTLLLLSLYQRMEHRFADKTTKKKHVWNSIADEMKRHSYIFTGDQCKGRWNTLLTALKLD